MSQVLGHSVEGLRSRRERLTSVVRSRLFWAHDAGGAAGGLVLGVALAAVAAVTPDEPDVVGLFIGLALVSWSSVVLDGRLRELWPQRRRQVPLHWRNNGSPPHAVAFGWGAVLGMGFATYLVSPLLYTFALLAIVAPAPAALVPIGVLYGLARSTAVRFATYQTSAAAPVSWFHTIQGSARRRVVLTAAPFVAVTVAALASAAVSS